MLQDNQPAHLKLSLQVFTVCLCMQGRLLPSWNLFVMLKESSDLCRYLLCNMQAMLCGATLAILANTKMLPVCWAVPMPSMHHIRYITAPSQALKQWRVMNSIHFYRRCSVYTVCTATTSLCASATPRPTATADTSPPVITVRAPASNSINATGYVATTVYVGTPNTSALVCSGVSLMSHLMSAVMLLPYAASQTRCCRVSMYMQSSHLRPFTADLGPMADASPTHTLSPQFAVSFQILQCHAFNAISFLRALNAI